MIGPEILKLKLYCTVPQLSQTCSPSIIQWSVFRSHSLHSSVRASVCSSDILTHSTPYQSVLHLFLSPYEPLVYTSYRHQPELGSSYLGLASHTYGRVQGRVNKTGRLLQQHQIPYREHRPVEQKAYRFSKYNLLWTKSIYKDITLM